MICKLIKLGVLTAGGAALVGGVVLGTDAGSYLRSTCRSVRTSVKDRIPTEFELKRARDLLDDAGPEMRQNVRLIAEQEVEIGAARSDIERCQTSLAEETLRVQKLRNCLGTSQTAFTIGDFNYSRDQLKQELARRFDRFKEAERSLSEKKKLLENRQKGLLAAMQTMESARSHRAELQSQIDALEGKYRLAQAASHGSNVQIDNTKLAQAEKLIGDIRRQLDIDEHMLAHEAKFTQPMQIDVIDEKDLMAQLDSHFGETAPQAAVGSH
jgi:chromosome segregation ATPase